MKCVGEEIGSSPLSELQFEHTTMRFVFCSKMEQCIVLLMQVQFLLLSRFSVIDTVNGSVYVKGFVV
jgi:hypothetical protein